MPAIYFNFGIQWMCADFESWYILYHQYHITLHWVSVNVKCNYIGTWWCLHKRPKLISQRNFAVWRLPWLAPPARDSLVCILVEIKSMYLCWCWGWVENRVEGASDVVWEWACLCLLGQDHIPVNPIKGLLPYFCVYSALTTVCLPFWRLVSSSWPPCSSRKQVCRRWPPKQLGWEWTQRGGDWSHSVSEQKHHYIMCAMSCVLYQCSGYQNV